eukprot:scaffold1749_cov181-Amphora_coffeaeformis.AAC.4
MSDVIVLTVGKTVNGRDDEPLVTPEVQDALQRGWDRRQTQGLKPGSLWIVWTGDTIDTKDSKAWIDKVVLQDWTSTLSKESSSSMNVIQDWQLFHGGPTEYATVVRDFVQQQSATDNLSSLVPADGLSTLLNRVYATVHGNLHQSISQNEPLFLSPNPIGTLSSLPELIEIALRSSVLSGEPVEETQESAVPAESADPTDTDNTVLLQLEQVQALLDDYWLAKPSAGLTLPPDLIQPLQSVLPRNHNNQLVGTELANLMEQHAIILRDYYGRLYESLLESGRANRDALKSLSKQYMSVAQRVTKRIRRHVKDANQIYQSSYRGLQEDLEDIHDRWKSASDVLFEEDDEDEERDSEGSSASRRRRRRIPPWLQRLSVRALVLGVNYLQGWLAWQGIQRAALARERQLPKFPLF